MVRMIVATMSVRHTLTLTLALTLALTPTLTPTLTLTLGQWVAFLSFLSEILIGPQGLLSILQKQGSL